MEFPLRALHAQPPSPTHPTRFLQLRMMAQVHDKKREMLEAKHENELKELPQEQKQVRESNYKAYKKSRELHLQVWRLVDAEGRGLGPWRGKEQIMYRFVQ